MKHAQLITETLVPFDRARQVLPGKPTRNQLNNWRKRGIVYWHDGIRTIVRLETVKIGGHPCTTVEAFNRFIERTNE
jgi:hypothetical protein